MIFSIDVEGQSQSVNKDHIASGTVVDDTLRLLDRLNKHQHKATFFTLGNVAEKHPELVRRISENGHEVASHGYSHRSIFNLTPKQVKEEVGSSVKLLEDISGTKVIGFRAPNFSIREYLFEWYCEALAENELKYDSSLFPMKVIKYGIEQEYSLKIFNEYQINEHYLSYMKLGTYKLPFFGGSFFKAAPYPLTKLLSKQLDKNHAVFYMRPYELAGDNSVEKKLNKLMNDFQFTSFKQEYYAKNSSTIHQSTLGIEDVPHTIANEETVKTSYS